MTSAAHFDAPRALADSTEWIAYTIAPCFELLGPLLEVARDRPDELLELLEGAFADGRNWEVAQHLTALMALDMGIVTLRDMWSRYPAVVAPDGVARRAAWFTERLAKT